MRMDLLTEGLRIEPSDEVLDMLKPAAKEFLLAGGCLSLGDWNRLSEASRGAFVGAADEIRDEEAASLPWAGGTT